MDDKNQKIKAKKPAKKIASKKKSPGKKNDKFFNRIKEFLNEKKIEILSKYAPRENNNRQTTETEEGISPPQKPSIVLTPGAQFEYENPEKVNVVDLRNPK